MNIVPFIPTILSVLGTIFKKKPDNSNQPYNKIATPLADFLNSRLGKTMPTYNSPLQGTLNNALAGRPSANFESNFLTQYQKPAERILQQDILPKVATQYEGAGTYWGGERARAEQKATQDTYNKLSETKVLAADRDISQTLQYTPAIIQQEYERYLHTLPEYSPLIRMSLDLLKETPYTVPSPNKDLSALAALLSQIDWKELFSKK